MVRPIPVARPEVSSVVLYLIFLGAPGAGKGTQVERLAAASGLPHVSTGNLFRENLQQRTELGLLAESIMKAGDLVPDTVTIDMVRDRLARPDCAGGALLDGFPRNLIQADAMAEIANAPAATLQAVFLNLDDTECMNRITGRRQCRDCGLICHIRFAPPQVDGICDKCGGELYQRDDDNPATVERRILAYYRETAPLLGYYHALRSLLTVEADGAPDRVGDRLREALAGLVEFGPE